MIGRIYRSTELKDTFRRHHGIDLNALKEAYGLIQEKKSKLSKAKRDGVVKVWEAYEKER
jgi:hypothetical protein